MQSSKSGARSGRWNGSKKSLLERSTSRLPRVEFMDALTKPHSFPGKLIVVEGIDGSGKSTQLQLVKRYLEARGLQPFFTEWNSADLVKAVTKRGKKKMSLTTIKFSTLHETDFA